MCLSLRHLVVQLAFVTGSGQRHRPGTWDGIMLSLLVRALHPPQCSPFVRRKPESSNHPQEGKVGKTRARGPANPTLCCGSGSQGARGAKTQVDHRPVRKSQGSVSFIPLGADNIGWILKQSCGLRLWAEMLVESLGCCRKELVPEGHLATKWM